MPRAVAEWRGKTPDARVPPRVRLRVLEAYDRKCYLTGREIRPGDAWELEHVVALILGGEHRERNLAPALVAPHKRKTAAEMKVKAKIADIAKAAYGIAGPKQRIVSRPFPKRPPRAAKPSLPPINIFTRGQLLAPSLNEDLD